MVLLLIKNMLDAQESYPAVNDPGFLYHSNSGHLNDARNRQLI